MDSRVEKTAARSWTLAELNTQSSIMQSYPLRLDQIRLPRVQHGGVEKQFSPIKGFCRSKLYMSSSHKTHGSFYRSASSSMLSSSRPWRHGIKNNFSDGFDGSGMYRDTRIDSLMKERERQKLEAESRRKKALQKEQFVARQLAVLEEKRQRRIRRRERKRERHNMRCDAATLLQGRGRIIIARNEANARRRVRDGFFAMRIQRLVRRVNECRSSKLLLAQLRRKRSAIIIQSAQRTRVAHKIASERARLRDEERARLFEIYKNEQAVNIQRVIRGIEGRKRASRLKRKRKAKRKRRK